jgi:hypothetical protein
LYTWSEFREATDLGKDALDPQKSTDTKQTIELLLYAQGGAISDNHLDISGGTNAIVLVDLELWFILTGAWTKLREDDLKSQGIDWDPGAGLEQMLPAGPSNIILMGSGHLISS